MVGFGTGPGARPREARDARPRGRVRRRDGPLPASLGRLGHILTSSRRNVGRETPRLSLNGPFFFPAARSGSANPHARRRRRREALLPDSSRGVAGRAKFFATTRDEGVGVAFSPRGIAAPRGDRAAAASRRDGPRRRPGRPRAEPSSSLRERRFRQKPSRRRTRTCDLLLRERVRKGRILYLFQGGGAARSSWRRGAYLPGGRVDAAGWSRRRREVVASMPRDDRVDAAR